MFEYYPYYFTSIVSILTYVRWPNKEPFIIPHAILSVFLLFKVIDLGVLNNEDSLTLKMSKEPEIETKQQNCYIKNFLKKC